MSSSPGPPEGQTELKFRFRRALEEGARLLHAGRPSEALPHLELAFELVPSDADAAINLGGAHILLNEYQRAVQILEEAAASRPDNSRIWINLGAAYLGNPVLATPEMRALAIAAFEKALELDPLAPSVDYNLGLIHRDRGDLVAAKAHFRQAIAVDPLDRDARRLLARLESGAVRDAASELAPARRSGGE